MFNEKSSLYPGESKSHNNSRVESVFYLSKDSTCPMDISSRDKLLVSRIP